jgi:hypothetical protein
VIKAQGRFPSGKPLLALGLTEEDWAHLRLGQSIQVNLRDLLGRGMPNLTVVLLGGATEESLIADLEAIGWLQQTAAVGRHRR